MIVSTTCDIDDTNFPYKAAGDVFAALLRDLAMEHLTIKLENTRLRSKIDNPKEKSVTRLDVEEVHLFVQDSAAEVRHDSSNRSKALPIDDTVMSETVAQESSKPSDSQDVPWKNITVNSANKLQLHPLWAQSVESLPTPGHSRSVSQRASFKLPRDAARGGDSLKDNFCLQRFIVGPNDTKRVFWDILSISVLSMNIVMAPMTAFELPESQGWNIANWVSTLFWTFDMFASFCTGFHIEGAIEMRPRKVVHNYVRTWLCFDLVVVLVDWLLLIATSNLAEYVGLSRVCKLVRVGRIFRALRLFRLLRIFKMPTEQLTEAIESRRTEGLLIGFRVMRALLTILVANHFLACGWYAVGQMSSPSWVTELDDAGRDLAFKYVSALHWSLTQFTPASMEIHPRSFPERVYAICVMFVALVVFSSFVSSITNSMNSWRQMNKETHKQRQALRRYIRENKLSLELTSRITAFSKNLNVRSRVRVHEYQVDALKMLPESLKLQLHWEVFVPILSRHEFFRLCADLFEPFLLELCHTALSETSIRLGQELFCQDAQAESMYFIISGFLKYYETPIDSWSHSKSEMQVATPKADEIHVVGEGTWCCEIALWLNWTHEGRLAASSHMEAVTLDASVFRQQVVRNIPLFEVCKRYALSFQSALFDLGDDKPFHIFSNHEALFTMANVAFGRAGSHGSKEYCGGSYNSLNWKQWRRRTWSALGLHSLSL